MSPPLGASRLRLCLIVQLLGSYGARGSTNDSCSYIRNAERHPSVPDKPLLFRKNVGIASFPCTSSQQVREPHPAVDNSNRKRNWGSHRFSKKANSIIIELATNEENDDANAPSSQMLSGWRLCQAPP